MEYFAEASKNWTFLIKILLNDNNIGTIGMKFFIEASKNFTNLITLKL